VEPEGGYDNTNPSISHRHSTQKSVQLPQRNWTITECIYRTTKASYLRDLSYCSEIYVPVTRKQPFKLLGCGPCLEFKNQRKLRKLIIIIIIITTTTTTTTTTITTTTTTTIY
jgi:hypothetical protein